MSLPHRVCRAIAGSATTTTNALSTYTFKSTLLLSGVATIRVVEINGEPWFVAADVCRALGVYVYDGRVSITMATAKLGAAEKRGLEANNPIFPSLGLDRRVKKVIIVSESGLYKMIMRSDVALAKPFQDWVTQEVLPSIRKNGGYIAGQERLRSGEMSDLEFLARAQEVAGRVLAQVQEDNKRLLQEKKQLLEAAKELEAENDELYNENVELAPKAAAWETLVAADGWPQPHVPTIIPRQETRRRNGQ